LNLATETARCTGGSALLIKQARAPYEESQKASGVQGLRLPDAEKLVAPSPLRAKADHLAMGNNPRFLVTSLSSQTWAAKPCTKSSTVTWLDTSYLLCYVSRELTLR
jgi:hypothetical protein